MANNGHDRRWDTIIVGQGLAGTTLGWMLTFAGDRVLIIDPNVASTSSRVAAGLMTPIVGQRLTLNWRFDEFWPVAETFYRKVEAHTGSQFLFERTAYRVLGDDRDMAAWQERATRADYQAHLIAAPSVSVDALNLSAGSVGGFAMRAAQLDVATYLDVSRRALEVRSSAVDWSTDVRFGTDNVTVLGDEANRVISCEGFAAAQNPYFSWVSFSSVKGEILTVRFDRPRDPITLHKGIWMAPTADPHIFRVGATYDRSSLDTTPTPAARQELETKLRELIAEPFEVIDHKAAVRPKIWNQKALIGLHPRYPQLGFFNGLASKAALQAPWFADAFARYLLGQTDLPSDVDLTQRFAP